MSGSKWIFLDNNSTTCCDPRVVGAMLPYLSESYANPSSAHLFGSSIDEAVDEARDEIAGFIGSKPHEIIFTSGATESLNMAIKGFLDQPKREIVTIASEHKAVLDVCGFMETKGFSVKYIAVGKDGSIDCDELSQAITSETLLVAAMFANNETGVIHPVDKIAKIAHQKGALLLCDATQAVGKLSVDVKKLGIDIMAFSAHKFYGPKGIGALYISSDCQPKPQSLIHGGGQQRNRRSGTLNVPGIIAFAKACTIAASQIEEDELRIRALRDRLENGLLSIEGSFVNGFGQSRLYNTTNICFPGTDSEKLIITLPQIALSNGAACSVVSTEPSHVLKAMGLSDGDAMASIRCSLGRFTTAEDIESAIATLTRLIPALRNQ